MYVLIKLLVTKANKSKALMEISDLSNNNKILKEDFLALEKLFNSKSSLKTKEDYDKHIRKAKNKSIRHSKLMEKYGEEKGLKIFLGETWVGMKKEELIDSAGAPGDSDKEVLKTKTKENYYYYKDLKKKEYTTYYMEDDIVVKIFEK